MNSGQPDAGCVELVVENAWAARARFARERRLGRGGCVGMNENGRPTRARFAHEGRLGRGGCVGMNENGRPTRVRASRMKGGWVEVGVWV
jgi:hypothetical protein